MFCGNIIFFKKVVENSFSLNVRPFSKSPPDNGDCDGDGDGENLPIRNFAENKMS